MNNIKISIIVPCYNQAEFLEEALSSVLNQTFTFWECIIVNDGSNDETEVISKKWITKYSNFSYYFKENSGLSNARNFGIEKATAELILPLDADDKIGSRYLELAYKTFQENKSLKLIYCEAEKFQEKNGKWKLPKFSLSELSRNNMIFCSAIFKKKDWKLIGGYDNEMKYGWEDWEFYISLLKNGGEVHKLNYIGFYYRIKSNSMLQSISQEQSRELLEYLSVKHADFFVKHYGSFHQMEEKMIKMRQLFVENLKSEKFLINILFKKIFGIRIFKLKQ